jgi:hypothetical protein
MSAMNHPPYSPDLAAADFWLFPRLKESVERKAFLGHGGCTCRTFCEKMTDIPVQHFKNCIEQGPKRWEHYKELEGDYSNQF